MKSLVHTKELCFRRVPLEYAEGAKSLVCIGLYIASLIALCIEKCINITKSRNYPISSAVGGNNAFVMFFILLLLLF